MSLPKKLSAGTLINKANLSDLVNAVMSGATVVLAGEAPTGFTRKFQHQDWVDFVDPVQAGGNNGFNERFHALEQEFDRIAAATSSVDNAVKHLQTSPPTIGLLWKEFTWSPSDIYHSQATFHIWTPQGFSPSDTIFFTFPISYWPRTANAGDIGFGIEVSKDAEGGVVTATCYSFGGTLTVGCLAIARKGGWRDADHS